MDNDVQEAIAKVYETRASKDETTLLRWLIGILIVAFLGAGGLGAYANSGTGERISVVETKIDGFGARQDENNGLLKDIEKLLREGNFHAHD